MLKNLKNAKKNLLKLLADILEVSFFSFYFSHCFRFVYIYIVVGILIFSHSPFMYLSFCVMKFLIFTFTDPQNKISS
jgi:hypothetical protein